MEFRIFSMGFYFEWLLLAKVRMTISIESLMLKLEHSCTRMLVELWDEEILLKVWDKLCLDDRIQGVGFIFKAIHYGMRNTWYKLAIIWLLCGLILHNFLPTQPVLSRNIDDALVINWYICQIQMLILYKYKLYLGERLEPKATRLLVGCITPHWDIFII